MNLVFDLYDYLDKLSKSNKLATENQFHFCKVSGVYGLEEAVETMKLYKNFIAVDDFTDGKIFNAGTGFFTRYLFTIFLFSRFNTKSMDDKIAKLNLCRDIRNQIYSRFILDRNRIPAVRYLNTNECIFREFSGSQLSGCTGTMFQFNVDIPTELCYNKEEWK